MCVTPLLRPGWLKPSGPQKWCYKHVPPNAFLDVSRTLGQNIKDCFPFCLLSQKVLKRENNLLWAHVSCCTNFVCYIRLKSYLCLIFFVFNVGLHCISYFIYGGYDLPCPSCRLVFCQMWVHLHKYFSPQVVSHVFCLPPNYRKDVLPPTGTENYFWTMNNSELPSDLIFMFPIWESLKISVNFDVSRICLHDFSQNPTKVFLQTTKKIWEFVAFQKTVGLCLFSSSFQFLK